MGESAVTARKEIWHANMLGCNFTLAEVNGSCKIDLKWERGQTDDTEVKNVKTLPFNWKRILFFWSQLDLHSSIAWKLLVLVICHRDPGGSQACAWPLRTFNRLLEKQNMKSAHWFKWESPDRFHSCFLGIPLAYYGSVKQSANIFCFFSSWHYSLLDCFQAGA